MVTFNKKMSNTRNNDDATTHEESPESLNHSSVALLIDTNQCLLQAMRVSHPSIERICHITKYKYGLSTKLTGAGGGGCVFTYLGDLAADNASATTESIVQDLQMEGFQCMESTVGGAGVLWVEPVETNFNGS
jgi:mevalonate kinase